MKKILSFSFILVLCASLCAQSVTLTFTGRDANNQRVQLNRVVITNLTKGWQETIHWPDTTLTMQNGTGIDDFANNGGFGLMQNNPNPFNGTTDVLLAVADAGAVTLEITDLNGRAIVEAQCIAPLQNGTHQFRITLSAAGTYLMTARQNGKTSSVKMVNNGGGDGNGVEYVGIVETMCTSSLQSKSGTRGNTTNPFTFGDQMEYVGYATINGTEKESERITQQPSALQTTCVLQFPSSPCNGTLSDVDGNVYNMIQIGNQCWMKENLRTTKYADNTSISHGSEISTTVAYWYYPNNTSSNKPTYGLLYNWPAVMHNSNASSINPSGVQGICPNGWHVPSDAEWTQLTDYVSSQSQYVCGSTNTSIAKSLAGTTGWHGSTMDCVVGNSPSSNNATGFGALPAGRYDGDFYYFGESTGFWSTTEIADTLAYLRLLKYNNDFVYRGNNNKYHSYSVRCLRD